jgi:hypothetical protein
MESRRVQWFEHVEEQHIVVCEDDPVPRRKPPFNLKRESILKEIVACDHELNLPGLSLNRMDLIVRRRYRLIRQIKQFVIDMTRWLDRHPKYKFK